jgi:hypothetical protein
LGLGLGLGLSLSPRLVAEQPLLPVKGLKPR